jgi:hypothetical protein
VTEVACRVQADNFDSPFTLDGAQTNLFLENVEGSNFWKLPSVLEDRGVDGAQWIIEGMREWQVPHR